MINKKLGVAKLQLAFWCIWLWKVLRLCDMSGLQDTSSMLFINMTGPKVAQRIYVGPLCFMRQRLLGLFCLELNTIVW